MQKLPRTKSFGARSGIIFVLLGIVVFIQVPGTTAFSHVLQKLGHPLVFAIVAWLSLSLLRDAGKPRNGRGAIHYIVALAVTIVFGATTEVAQAFVHRDPSVFDVLRDALGATAALAGLYAVERPPQGPAPPVRGRAGAGVIAVALVAAIVAPMALCIVAYAHRDLGFPILAQFESPLDLYFISRSDIGRDRIPEPRRWARAAREIALEVPLLSEPYPGVTLEEPYPNWRGRSSLALDLTNPGTAALQLTVKVEDRRHGHDYRDRFDRDFTLAAGSRTVTQITLRDIESAPIGPPMDMRHIARVQLFRSGGSGPAVLLLNRIWLQ